MNKQHKRPRSLRRRFAWAVLNGGIILFTMCAVMVIWHELPIARGIAGYLNNPPVPEGLAALIPQNRLQTVYLMEGFVLGGLFCTLFAVCALLISGYSLGPKEPQE